MIKIRKYDLDGYGIESTPEGTDLTAVALKKYEIGKSEPFCGGYFQEMDVFSKISTIDENFRVKDIVPIECVDRNVCAIFKDSIVYSEREKSYEFKCTSSANTYGNLISNYSYKQYGDVFVIEEGDKKCKRKKVTVFDARLNSLKTETIAFKENNEYESARIEEASKIDVVCNELNNLYPDYLIDYTENTMAAVLERREFVAVCYYRKNAKNYLCKFKSDGTMAWRIQASENLMTSYVLPFGVYYYCIYPTDSLCFKWRLEKLSAVGEILDTYVFNGSVDKIIEYNRKPVIIYTDFTQFLPWQKQLLKEQGGSFGPSALLVIED